MRTCPSLWDTEKTAPALKLVNLQELITTSELRKMHPAVQLLSFPMNSQFTRFTLLLGKATKQGIFGFKFLGRDLNDRRHPLKISPPLLTNTIVFIFFSISNSDMHFTLAFL